MDALKNRRSVRKFDKNPEIMEALEAFNVKRQEIMTDKNYINNIFNVIRNSD